MSEWKEVVLGNISTITSSKRIFYADYVAEGIPFYRSKEIIEKALGESIAEPLYISHERFYNIKNQYGAPKFGELLIAAVGERAGIPYFITDTQDFYFKDGNLIWLKDFDREVDSHYLYYFFISANGKQLLEGSMIGSAQKALTIIGLKSLSISFPPIVEQNAIVEVLSSLDDKIDLLHRQNQTLEAMAQTLFKQWFVVEAKEDWEEKSLDEIAHFLNGLPCQKYLPTNAIDRLPVIKIRELRTGFTDSSDWATTQVPAKYIVQPGDVVFSWSGSLEVLLWPYSQGILNQHLFKVTSEIYPKWFYYLAVKHHLVDFRSVAEDKATTMGHIQRHHLTEATIATPPVDAFKGLNKTFAPLIAKIIDNQSQLTTLQTLRDTLLPKLMSGEVRVKM